MWLRRRGCAGGCAGDQTCGGVLDSLKPLNQSVSNTVHETVAVVQRVDTNSLASYNTVQVLHHGFVPAVVI